MGRSSRLALLSCFLREASAIRINTRGNSSVNEAYSTYSIPLGNVENVQYTGPFAVGGQELPVIYDTGSFEILVLSTMCSKCVGGRAPVYDNTVSSSYQGTSTTAEHHFGSGPALSEKGYENVRVGTPSSPYVANRMPFWQIIDHDIEVWTSNSKFSGIVGLGHTDGIPEGYGMATSVDESLLKSVGVNTFAFCLERGRAGAPGWLIMHPSVSPHLFDVVPVEGKVHWGLRMASFSAPGVSAPDPCNPSCGAIIDSGTSLIAVPPSAQHLVNGLKALIKKDCSNVHSLPVLRLVLGGVTLELPPQAYVMQVNGLALRNSSILDALLGGPYFEEVTTCQLAFMQMDKQSQLGPVFILGMPFLRYYYTVFDRYQKTISISQASQDCQPTGMSGTPSHFMANESTGKLGNVSQTSSTMRRFSKSDFEPLVTDLSVARAPSWAFSNISAWIF